MFFLMNDSKKIDLLYVAADEVRYIRDQADEKIASVYRQLLLDFQTEADMSRDEAYYELYMLGVRIESDCLEV